ncbi:carboxylesterase family protein [Streptodolium elevatio]
MAVAPAPREPWSGIRPAYVFGAALPQTAMVPGEASPWEPEDGLDCLTTNVWTPDLGAAGMPVMVWIYGGAWRFGRSAVPMYDGTKLARAGGKTRMWDLPPRVAGDPQRVSRAIWRPLSGM